MGDVMNERWEIRDDRTVFENQILRAHLEDFRTPDGREGTWTVVDIGDGAAVLPVHEDGAFHLICQYRPAVQEWVWELPAGRVESGEEPIAAARRELEEEAGLRAAKIESLGVSVPLAGICRHRIHFFRATELEDVSTAHERFEDIEVRRLGAAEVREMVAQGAILDGVAMALLLRHEWGLDA